MLNQQHSEASDQAHLTPSTLSSESISCVRGDAVQLLQEGVHNLDAAADDS